MQIPECRSMYHDDFELPKIKNTPFNSICFHHYPLTFQLNNLPPVKRFQIKLLGENPYITSLDKKHWEEFVIRLSNVWWFPEGENQEQLDQGCGPGQDNPTASPENTKFSKQVKNNWQTVIHRNQCWHSASFNIQHTFFDSESWPKYWSHPNFWWCRILIKRHCNWFSFHKTSIYWLYYLQPKWWKTTKASSWFMHLFCTQFPVVKLTTSLLSWLPEAVWGHTELVREYYWYWHYLLQCYTSNALHTPARIPFRAFLYLSCIGPAQQMKCWLSFFLK